MFCFILQQIIVGFVITVDIMADWIFSGYNNYGVGL